jgi:hypothetical protein
MEKILTIFDRDWEGNRGVIDEPVKSIMDEGGLICLMEGIASEKFDGTNVRITIRNHTCVRLEKRRNPTKVQKHKKIIDPWYIDADEYGPDDKYLFEAVEGTDLEYIPDGEWSAEAIGPKIQGNPLDRQAHMLIVFSLKLHRKLIKIDNVPVTFNELREWLPRQRSCMNPDRPIEGIVWHMPDGRMFKIKTKDFK